MATNFVQEGQTLDLLAPYQRNAGQGALIGSIFGVALNTVASGATGQFMVEGVFTLTKTSAQAWVLGDRIYWDDTNKRCDNDPTVGPLIGAATAVAANPSSTGQVRLNESVPGLDEAKQQAQVPDLVDNGGGGTADGTIGAISAAAGACAGGSSPSATNVDTAIATATGQLATTTKDAVKELSTKINALLAELRLAGIIKT